MGSLTTIQGGVCSELNNDFDKMLNSILGSKSTLNPQLEKYKSMLRENSNWSAPAVLSNGLSQVSDLSSEIPTFGEEDFKAVKTVIESCSYLKYHSFLSEPLNILNKLQVTIKENLLGAATTISDTLGVSEINFAVLGTELAALYNKFGFGALIPSKLSLVDCIQNMCGTDIREKLDRFNMLQRMLHIGSDGALDFEELYTSCNITEYAKNNMRQSITTVGGLMYQVDSSVNTGLDIVKSKGRGVDWI